jgi:hypothetical protein
MVTLLVVFHASACHTWHQSYSPLSIHSSHLSISSESTSVRGIHNSCHVKRLRVVINSHYFRSSLIRNLSLVHKLSAL